MIWIKNIIVSGVNYTVRAFDRNLGNYVVNWNGMQVMVHDGFVQEPEQGSTMLHWDVLAKVREECLLRVADFDYDFLPTAVTFKEGYPQLVTRKK